MFRRIEKQDIKACLDIYNWYIENTTITFETEQLSLEDFTKRIESITKEYPFIVYEDEGRIVGYAYLGHFNERAAYDWTADLSIYLDHELRGKGYGDKLMAKIIEIAKNDGYVNLVSLITGGNLPSENIHAKHGFVKEAEFMDFGYKFNKWLSVSYYTLRLNDPSTITNRPVDGDFDC